MLTMSVWRPGVHDPAPIAWVVTLAYLVVALMCLWAWRVQESSTRSAGLVWLGLSLLLLGLGVNKQLDLQTLMIQVGRDLSHAQGWYEQRRMVLGGFLILGACGAVLMAIGVFRWHHGSCTELRGAVAGAALLLVMLLVQASHGSVADARNQNFLPVNSEVLEVQVEEVLELVFLIGMGWMAGRVAGGWNRRGAEVAE